mgnify:CR=1 FL=1
MTETEQERAAKEPDTLDRIIYYNMSQFSKSEDQTINTDLFILPSLESLDSYSRKYMDLTPVIRNTVVLEGDLAPNFAQSSSETVCMLSRPCDSVLLTEKFNDVVTPCFMSSKNLHITFEAAQGYASDSRVTSFIKYRLKASETIQFGLTKDAWAGIGEFIVTHGCLLYTSPSPRD